MDDDENIMWAKCAQIFSRTHFLVENTPFSEENTFVSKKQTSLFRGEYPFDIREMKTFNTFLQKFWEREAENSLGCKLYFLTSQVQCDCFPCHCGQIIKQSIS